MKYQYISYDETLEFFAEAKKKYPDLIDTKVIGKTWENRDILMVIISKDVKNAHKKPALLYTGTIHAREWIGIELAVAFAKHIIEQIDLEPLIDILFTNGTIYMVPCLNPDGFEYSRNHFSFWRKNRRQNADGSFGVDLNRNFPVGFKKSNDPSSNIYGGPEPFSEPETSAMRDFMQEGNHNITIALDYHSQGNVFFPAHNFKHEDTIDTTDMNVLCANMANSIKSVSNREYGIHQGKPPANLISGSGREFYYSYGIISTVVEVGSRNISDYIENMSENVQEHIPALLQALKEVPNYDKQNPLKRVEKFSANVLSSKEVELSWDYDRDDCFFEIYKSKDDKSFCNKSNLIKVTKAKEYIVTNLDSATDYYFYIRAVDNKVKLKSPYAPRIKVKTFVSDDEFYKILFPIRSEVGYVAQKFSDNKKHFGVNSLFIGVDERRGISYGVCAFSLETMPKNAIIESARVSLYPINRVSTTIENFGEWNVGMVKQSTLQDMTDYKDLSSAKIVQYVGRPTKSQHLTQGIWRKWPFSNLECSLLQKELEKDRVVFRIDGPNSLRFGRKSQMMQWDIGYGKFGYGLEYRPQLHIKYTIPTVDLVTKTYKKYCICRNDKKDEKQLLAGYDKDGHRIFSVLDFDLSSLPDYDQNVIVKARLTLNTNKQSADLPLNMRFYVALLEYSDEYDYKFIKGENVLERIGFDISSVDLKTSTKQHFIFDTLPLKELQDRIKDNKKIAFAIIPTSSSKVMQNKYFKFLNSQTHSPKLVMEYIKKRRYPPKQVDNLTVTKDKGMIKLNWKNPEDEAFKGVVVVKNPFRVPCDYNDGQKLYGGKDEYTYDNFGALDVDKYYAVFSYDDVPNFSEPVVYEYKA
jgi:predicted deacylase